ncbi:MAG TPA: nuclear transport factor 2 family protein [Steroidobacteraceae bacterium]|nr:nuclear transport factor 2 family protein [Steroidobacteraceae bacterium]
MDPTMTRAVLAAADVSAITQLVLTERESRDLGRWEELGACYLPDSRVEISWISGTGAQFVAGSVEMARRGVKARHRLGPVLVRLNAERALASLSCVIDIPGELHGVEFCLSSHARLLYPVERRDARWGLMGFYGIYVRDEIITRIPGQKLPILAQELAAFRPSYRMLSWLLTNQGGYVVNHDLPGVDRPEAAEALEQKLLAWAGL